MVAYSARPESIRSAPLPNRAYDRIDIGSIRICAGREGKLFRRYGYSISEAGY